MSNQKRYKAREYGEQRIEALGEKPYLEFECSDGTIVTIRNQNRLDDDAMGRFEQLEASLDREPVLDADGRPMFHRQTGEPLTRVARPHRIGGELAEPMVVLRARALLGERDHKKLLDDGMTSAEIIDAWMSLSKPVGPVEDPDEADGEAPKGSRS
ncbi:hypothetical protein E2F47_23520 [Mycobacterium eburneum]|nr:hypothetical protein [Mycobacterium eburneum]TDH48489.1 hypothetical protein E2F47_23520 [Mycobacterium eburneum]